MISSAGHGSINYYYSMYDVFWLVDMSCASRNSSAMCLSTPHRIREENYKSPEPYLARNKMETCMVCVLALWTIKWSNNDSFVPEQLIKERSHAMTSKVKHYYYIHFSDFMGDSSSDRTSSNNRGQPIQQCRWLNINFWFDTFGRRG